MTSAEPSAFDPQILRRDAGRDRVPRIDGRAIVQRNGISRGVGTHRKDAGHVNRVIERGQDAGRGVRGRDLQRAIRGRRARAADVAALLLPDEPEQLPHLAVAQRVLIALGSRDRLVGHEVVGAQRHVRRTEVERRELAVRVGVALGDAGELLGGIDRDDSLPLRLHTVAGVHLIPARRGVADVREDRIEHVRWRAQIDEVQAQARGDAGRGRLLDERLAVHLHEPAPGVRAVFRDQALDAPHVGLRDQLGKLRLRNAVPAVSHRRRVHGCSPLPAVSFHHSRWENASCKNRYLARSSPNCWSIVSVLPISPAPV